MSENFNNKKSLKFNDSLAAVTQWSTISWAGHRFQDYAGARTSASCYEFKVTKDLYRYIIKLPIFLILVGVVLFIISLSVDFNPGLAFMFLGFLPLSGIGTAYWYYKFLRRPFIFDMQAGYFWKGNISPLEEQDITKIKICIKIEEIHALQLLHQRVKNFPISYHCYELNLVLKDGSRQILLNHTDQMKLQEDAAGLGVFLGIPVWDNTKK